MTHENIRALIIWLLNANFKTFCRGVYDEEVDYATDDPRTAYFKGKFEQMQNNTLTFLANLDVTNMSNLAATVNAYEITNL